MEILHPLTGQKALTLVDQLPSTLQEWPVMVNLLERAFKGTVKDGSKKSDSIGTAFKWVAVALGLADSNLDEDRQWNLRKYVEELQSNAIDIAHATVDADANAQIRITNRRRARQAANDAAIEAGRIAEEEATRPSKRHRVLPRRAAGDFDEDME